MIKRQWILSLTTFAFAYAAHAQSPPWARHHHSGSSSAPQVPPIAAPITAPVAPPAAAGTVQPGGILARPLPPIAPAAAPTAPALPLVDASLPQQGQPLGVDLFDIVKYEPTVLPDAAILTSLFPLKAPFDPRIVHPGETLFRFGGSRPVYANPDQCLHAQDDGSQDCDLAGTVRQAHLQEVPQINGDTAIYTVVATIANDAKLPQNKNPNIVFRKLSITVAKGANGQRQIVDVRTIRDTPIALTKFTIEVGLVSRAVLIEDRENGIRFLVPNGVGGLDMGVMGGGNRILTPRYPHAVLSRNLMAEIVPHPAYYQHQAFLPLINLDDPRAHEPETRHPIAFHLTILVGNDWTKFGPNYILRGFDSHGCMRFRLKDLTLLINIAKFSSLEETPVVVDYFIWNHDDLGNSVRSWNPINVLHPYPLRNDGYMGIKRFPVIDPAVEKPYHRDPKEKLTIMDNYQPLPDMSHFAAMNLDSLIQYFAAVNDPHYVATHKRPKVSSHPGGLSPEDQGQAPSPNNDAPPPGTLGRGAPSAAGSTPETAGLIPQVRN